MMKKCLWLLLPAMLLTALAGRLQAQDLILKTSGEEINVKITEINPADILYKKPDSLAGRTFTIPKKDVFRVSYASGDMELFNHLPPAGAEPSQADLSDLGRQDARRYYKGNGAMWGSAASMFLMTFYGSVIIAAVPPKINPAQVSDANLLRHPAYVRGYVRQAHKRKVGKAATGAGIGLAAIATVFVIVMGAGQ